MNHLPERPTKEISELLSGYALGALEPEEMEFIRRNLPRRPEWQRELDAYRTVTDALPYFAEPKQVPVRVRARVLQEIDAIESVNPLNPPFAARQPAAVDPRIRRQRIWAKRLPKVAWAAAIPATIIFIVFALYTVVTQNQINEQQGDIAVLAQAQDQLVDAFTQDEHAQTTITLTESSNAPLARGTLLINHNENMVAVFLRDIPIPNDDEFYAVWVTTDLFVNEWVRLGAVDIDEFGRGLLVLNAPDFLERYKNLYITRETSPDVPGPTGPEVMFGDL